MKTKSNWIIFGVITLIVLVLANGIYLYNSTTSTPTKNNTIDSLNRVNDSLSLVIRNNSSRIQKLDSMNSFYQNEVKITKSKLNELVIRTNIYKQLYNEERNRINNLSTPDLIREFTNSFK